jgi:UDP-glucose 4-epimerase
LIADVERITRLFSWRPRYADLDTIITHALKWEEGLAEAEAEGLIG